MKRRGKTRKQVFVFWGLTASGKSYLARAWAMRHGLTCYNTDLVRKGLAKGEKHRAKGICQGIYSPRYSRMTYDRMVELADEELATAAGVILDGSYLNASERKRVLDHYWASAEIFFILCSCSESVARQRLVLRETDSEAVSDATLEIYFHQVKEYREPVEIPAHRLLKLDTDAPLEYLMSRLDQLLVA